MTTTSATTSSTSLADFISRSINLLMTRTVKRVDGECSLGEVSMYWVGDVLRIDVKSSARFKVSTDTYQCTCIHYVGATVP